MADIEKQGPEDRLIVVSTDGHVGPSVTDQLRPYCEAKHLEDFDRFTEEMAAAGMLTWRSSEAKDGDDESWVIGKPRALASGEAEEFGKVAGFRNPDQMDRAFLQRSYEASLVPGLQDSTARLADMDRSGVAACVIYHGGLNGQSIPFSTTGLISWGHSRYNELEPVGVRIYNRWLADFVSDAPDRHIGIAHIPISDPKACAREVEWAAEHGLKGVNLPAPRGDFPMLNEPVWEPLWSACEETGLSLNTHGGGGEHYPYQGPGAQAMYMMETAWRTRRGAWVMILGGVFARHPGLKLVLTEQWMDWALQVMTDMDGLYNGTNGISLREALGKPPSEQFRQSCFLGASFMASWEARFGIEHDLVGNTMWGDDYPHPEGTWPHTREAMAATFCGIEQKYVRQYLGDVAIDVYNLDRAKLQEVADRIGPTVGQLSEACVPPEGETAGLYAFRTGPGAFI
ncbi:MAG TPA: amidohydrolase family protein [Acidimicrobiales bacterium]